MVPIKGNDTDVLCLCRSLINICSGRGFCEEDATCSCFLTDRGPHTKFADVSAHRNDVLSYSIT